MRITVFTPTYNRAYIIMDLYYSLQRQTFKDFEWLVIDDGSIDGTENLFEELQMRDNAFSICYYKQSNGGKCRAINQALELAKGELFFVVDSDDFLTDEALEKIDGWEKQLPKELNYCGISGNLGINKNTTNNYLFSDDYFDGCLLDRYSYINGERAYIFYTQIHRRYKYPVFYGEKFMTEAVVYNRMAHDGFKMRFYNDIVCVYRYQDDGLTYSGNKLFIENPKGYGLWLREKNEFMGTNSRNKFRLWYTYYCEMSFCEEKYRLSKKQIAEYIDAPPWAINVCAFIHKAKTIIRG